MRKPRERCPIVVGTLLIVVFRLIPFITNVGAFTFTTTPPPTQQKLIFSTVKNSKPAAFQNYEVDAATILDNALSDAFSSIASSSKFCEASLIQSGEYGNISNIKLPCFGPLASIQFRPRSSTLDRFGSPTEYILTANNFEQPVGDFGMFCMELYKYRSEIKHLIRIDDLEKQLLNHLNSLPPDPGIDAELASCEAMGNEDMSLLLKRTVDEEVLQALETNGYVVIDNVLFTTEVQNDRLSQYSHKSKTSQKEVRTDTVTFLKRNEALQCGVGEQYDFLYSLASHLNDNLNLHDSPYAPVFPATLERPLTNPNDGIQMAEYGTNDYYMAHSDNSVDMEQRGRPSWNEWGLKQRSNYRCITAILYLNDGWKKDDGGQLRLYLDSADTDVPTSAIDACSHIDINPKNGRLLLFDSRMIHSVEKVLNDHKTRRALTLWLTRPEGSGVAGEKYYLEDDDSD